MVRNKIRNQLLMTYIFLIIFPLMIISISIVNVYSDGIVEMEDESVKQSLVRINANLEKEFETYDYLVMFLLRDQQINQYLAKDSNLTEEVQEEKLQILLKGYVPKDSNVISISAVSMKGNYISSDADVKLDPSFYSSDNCDVCINHKNMNHIFSYGPGENPFHSVKTGYVDTLLICRAVTREDKIIGFINIVVNTKLFEEATQNVDLREGGYFYVIDNTGNIVYSPMARKDLHPNNKNEYSINNIKLTNTGWKLVVVKPLYFVLDKIKILRNKLILLFLVTIAVLVIVSIIISNSIVKPIKNLRNLMKKVEHGNLNVAFKGKINNEIYELGTGFNLMIEKINRLIDQVTVEQKEKKKTEIAMLQSNIKPHFLYNTLDTIRWMAKKYKAADIEETVNALATFFRVGLSKGEEVIKVSDEINHVECYLKIQKIRYDEILDYEINVDESCKNYYVQKLILQPFVENAIYHGIKESGEHGKINVSIWIDEDRLILEVKDNGMGIDLAKLQEINNSLREQKLVKTQGYGMKNVHQRIVLSYGNEYGVQVFSDGENGTRIIIAHPLIS